MKGVVMSRRSLIIGLLVLASASAAPAGELKFHVWPCGPTPLEITSIPVYMDVGYWIEILNQDAIIKLKQVNIHTYEGCTELYVRTNSHIRFSCTISPTKAIPGTYTCSISPADINPPKGTAKVCAKLTEANLAGRPGGARDVRVATITVRVVPRVL